MKTAFYVDGFNLYHAVDALDEPTLKWLDVRSLASSYLKEHDTLERVVFFTAFNTWDPGKRQRHVNFVKALESTGVEVILSRFDRVQKYCHRQDRYCPMREEKQTDVALAVEMLSDCYERGIERVVLVTADSDQVPVVKRIRQRFPSTVVFLVAPPKRLENARDLGRYCNGVAELTAGRLRQHALPETLRDSKNRLVASRPALYAPHTA